MEITYKTYENQSWLDISVHLFGTPQYAYRLAEVNHSCISQEILAGTMIQTNIDATEEKLVLLSLGENKSIPATAKQMIDEVTSRQAGIGYWMIGEFKVS